MATNDVSVPQIKICGLTRPEQAAACAAAGVAAVGCVFFPKSPRHVSASQAKEIIAALPAQVLSVGVFVDASFETIMRIARICGLRAIQLHGRESPQFVRRLATTGLRVFKALFDGSLPSPAEAQKYDAAAYLVECAKGPLPGGNALAWNWRRARPLGRRFPMILAGGLTPENVGQAIAASLADAVDVSSGVESAPGQKDLERVRRFVDAVCRTRDRFTNNEKKIRRVLA